MGKVGIVGKVFNGLSKLNPGLNFIEWLILVCVISLIGSILISASTTVKRHSAVWTVDCQPSTGLPRYTKISNITRYSPVVATEVVTGRERVFPPNGCSFYREESK